jgi:hypothetical protein
MWSINTALGVESACEDRMGVTEGIIPGVKASSAWAEDTALKVT